MTEEGRAREVREEARRLARKLGDQEWKKGNTKYAFEAYEASDITVVELFEKAQKLLEAVKLVLEWRHAYWTAEELPTTGHGDKDRHSQDCECVRCKTLNNEGESHHHYRRYSNSNQKFFHAFLLLLFL